MFSPLWTKTNYSFLEGASHPHEMFERASQLGITHMAVTDNNGLYGMSRANTAAKQFGINLIVGADLTLSTGEQVVCLAENKAGYKSLCTLITKGKKYTHKQDFILSYQDLTECSKGLIVLVPPRSLAIASKLHPFYKKSLYLLLTRHNTPCDTDNYRAIKAQEKLLNVPTVAATEVLYHSQERGPLQNVLTAIKHNTTLDKAGTKLRSNHRHQLLSPGDFKKLFADSPKEVDNTMRIAKRCTFTLDSIRYRYPEESLPEDVTSFSWLKKLTMEGAQKRFGKSLPKAVTMQIEKELALIKKLEYGGYFLTMHEIVRFCREKNILCQGRGSAANSIVCFCLGITSVDPVRLNLLFERFISLERAEPPDIDLDIEHQRREEVIQHVYTKYGRERAAMVANVVRFRARSAIRQVGKALGVCETLLDQTAKIAGHYGSMEQSVLPQIGVDKDNKVISLLFKYAQEIQDFPRHLSIHPGGFLLGDRPLNELVPVENATMPGRTIIQWDKDDIEALGLFKVDLLALGALTVIHRCFNLIEKHHNQTFHMHTIPAGDPKTYQMISKADTVGLFQIESRAQMSMLPRLRPNSFYDLVIQISLVRPGPISGGMVHPYLRRRAGKEKVTYPHPSLEPVLKKTLGIPLFQEQVMKLAMVAADYTPGEADQLRRDMAAWRRSGRIEKHREKLVSRMVAKGIRHDFAERVFEQIRGFGEYGFPESHAASFALISYATAYLRCHYLPEYLCAMLNSQPMGFYSPSTLVHDAKRHGVSVLPVCVNQSEWEATLQKKDDKLAVRLGLSSIKGLSRRTGETIVSNRRIPYKNTKDFCYRTKLDTLSRSKLAESGALRFGDSRRKQLWDTRSYNKQDKLELAKSEKRDISFAPLSRNQAISWDYQTQHLSPQGHPMLALREILQKMNIPTARVLNSRRHGQKQKYIGMVICRQRPQTAGGVVFMTLEDETGFVNLVIWETVFEKYKLIAKTKNLLGITGTLQVQEGIVHLVAESLWAPEMKATKTASRDFH